MPCWPAGFRAPSPPPKRSETPEEHIEAIRLTRLLCTLCATLDEEELTGLMSEELTAWWKEHRAADQRRLKADLNEQERARIVRAVYKRLKPAERLAIWGASEKPARARRKKR